MFKNKHTHLMVTAILTAGVSFSAGAVAIGELGILDDTANGGINPGTGAAWAPSAARIASPTWAVDAEPPTSGVTGARRVT